MDAFKLQLFMHKVSTVACGIEIKNTLFIGVSFFPSHICCAFDQLIKFLSIDSGSLLMWSLLDRGKVIK